MRKWIRFAISTVFALALATASVSSYAAVDQYGTLKKGDQSPGVYELQRALDELGFYKGSYSNVYNDQTVEALKAFQKSLKMSSDGVAGKQTLVLVRDHQLFLRNMNLLRPGVEGPRVTQLRADLKYLGFSAGSGSKFDDSLTKAIKAFQKTRNIKQDDKVGDVTLEAITKSMAAKRGFTAAEKITASKATETTKRTQAKTTQTKTTQTKTAAPKSNVGTASTKRTTSRGAKAVSIAKELLGISYRYGGSTKNGYDCSGFTMYVMNKMGVDLPHGAIAQSGMGSQVSKSALKEGDLVFFKTDEKRIGHVGIYIGGGRFIHASSGKGEVMISNLNTYQAKYVTARRVL